MDKSKEMNNKKPWKKNLYENQDYEDNYTDPSFLKDLQKNKNVKIFTLKEAIIGAAKLNNQISCITGFLLVFYFLYIGKIQPTQVLLFSGCITLIGYVLYSGRNTSIEIIIEDSKTLLTVLIFGYIFSPLLHTLTDAIDTDSIFSMTFFVMFLNLIYFDYEVSAAIVSNAISLNAAIFGSICLASRLTSSFHAFILLVVSSVFFVLYPIFNKKFWTPIFLIPIVLICSIILLNISIPLLITYLCILIFTNFICPWIFVIQQKHKNNIHGPWDEAIVKDTNSYEISKTLNF